MILLTREEIAVLLDAWAAVDDVGDETDAEIDDERDMVITKAQLKKVAGELTSILTSDAPMGKKLIQVVDLVAEMQSLLDEVK